MSGEKVVDYTISDECVRSVQFVMPAGQTKKRTLATGSYDASCLLTERTLVVDQANKAIDPPIYGRVCANGNDFDSVDFEISKSFEKDTVVRVRVCEERSVHIKVVRAAA